MELLFNLVFDSVMASTPLLSGLHATRIRFKMSENQFHLAFFRASQLLF